MQIQFKNEIAVLRKQKRNFPSICGVLSTYGFIALGVWSLKTFPLWAVGVPVFLLIGFMQYRLVMASHEAVHKNLFAPVWFNEAMGLFNASLVGISLFNYRKAHLDHHRAPQSIQDDIDGYIYRPLLLARPGFRRLGLLVFGVFMDIYVKIMRKLRGNAVEAGTCPAQEPEQTLSAVMLQLLPIAAVQVGIWLFFAWYLNWWSYLVFWFAPIFLIALSLDRARTFLEHGYNYFFPGPPIPNLAEVQQSTIDVRTNAVERYLFAPFGFSYHQAHHAQLLVPFYHLKKLSSVLEAHQPGYYRPVKGSYVALLFQMLWAHK